MPRQGRGGRARKESVPKPIPEISRAFILDTNSPGANIYDSDDSTYILQPQSSIKGNGHEWHSLPPGHFQVVLPFVIPREEDLEPAIIKALLGLARRMGRAVVLPPHEATKLTEKYSTVLKPPMDPWMRGKLLTIECPSLPPGTYLLLPAPEHFGLLMAQMSFEKKAPRSFGLMVHQMPRAVSIIPGTFDGYDGIIDIPELPIQRASMTVWDRVGVE